MKTRLLKRKYYEKSRRFEITQTHWFYIIPTIMVNINPNLLRFQWLFWEIDFAWNLKEPDGSNIGGYKNLKG